MVQDRLNEQRSLEIISQMIADTKSHIDNNSGKYFLLWGYTTVIITLFEYVVMTQHLPLTLTWGWFALPIVGGIGTFLLNQRAKRAGDTQPKSYLDRSVSAVWVTFGVSYLFIYIAALVYQTNIFFLTAIMMGMGTVISGAICRHKILTISGISGMCLSLLFPVRHVIFENMTAEGVQVSLNEYVIFSDYIIFALIFTIMMVIPGHVLLNRAKQTTNA